MKDRPMEDVLGAIEHLFDHIYEIPRLALSTYNDIPPGIRIDYDPRAQANCVWCHMQTEADRRLTGMPQVTLREINGMKVWLIGDAAVLRFKKMDEDGRSRNYPTLQQMKYDRGDIFKELPPPAVRLTAGYVLSPSGTEIDRVQVARPKGRKPAWCVAVNEPGASPRYEVIFREIAFG
jgi:hypothetical protein